MAEDYVIERMVFMDYLLSICILTYNKIEYTKECLKSLMKSKFSGKTEIIVVDNNSTDGTREWLMDFQNLNTSDDISIVIIANKKNYGCTGGRNQACSAAQGEYIITLDNDVTIISDDWINKMLKFYKEYPEIGILGPKLIFPQEPHLIQHAGLGVTEKGYVGYWGYGKDRHETKYNITKEVQGLAGACWLLKKSIFLENGYFDDIYFPVNFEDIDFCYRIREKGYKIVYYPEVELYHADHATTKHSDDIHFVRGIIKNGNIFRQRWEHVYKQEQPMEKEEYNWKIEKS